MSELEKIQAKAKGLRFMDMFVISLPPAEPAITDGLLARRHLAWASLATFSLPLPTSNTVSTSTGLQILAVIDVYSSNHSVPYARQPHKDDQLYYQEA